MSKGRLEAFSDGVLAIIITIMVLELATPHEPTWEALLPLVPVLLSYLLSFIYIGIYWNNHHHLFQACDRVSGRVLWANLHLLFWLSLLPFATSWMGETNFAAWPVAIYGVVQFFAAIAYFFLTQALIAIHPKDSKLVTALGSDFKGKISAVLLLIAVPLALVNSWLAGIIFVLIAVIWFVPDSRFERALP